MVRNRFPHFFLRHILVIVALGMGGVRSAQAQFGFLLNRAYAPQARSEEELDKYLEIITDSNPQTTVQEVNTFIAEYPQSELLGIAFQYQMIAYQRLNNFKGVLRAGKEALKLQPDNANTLLTLAAAIPDGVAGKPGAGPLLERANSYARGALQELGRMQIPRAIPLDHWKMMRAEMAAQAHEALGYVAAERGNQKKAISEFEAAALGNPIPQGSQFYRLGVAYALSGQRDRAENALRRAVALGPDRVREMAQAELNKLGGSDD